MSAAKKIWDEIIIYTLLQEVRFDESHFSEVNLLNEHYVVLLICDLDMLVSYNELKHICLCADLPGVINWVTLLHRASRKLTKWLRCNYIRCWHFLRLNKVRYSALSMCIGLELILFFKQSAHRSPSHNPVVGCRYFLPVLSIVYLWPVVPNYTAWWQRHMCLWRTWPVSLHESDWPGVQPTTTWSRV